jgi:large subunit ribosomal protein L29
MKVDELRVLEGDELGGRLRTARRELYELRFKHAVGQLENSSQISKVRHDIARIMTVLSERELGIAPIPEETAEANEIGASPLSGEVAAPAAGGEAQPAEAMAEVPETVAEVAPKPKRGRKAKTEETA